MSMYYLSLGDSLAAGWQPPASNVSFDHGYADQLATLLQAKFPGLETVKKLGCADGETTTTMIKGGSCPYQHGSQLDEAVAFLQLHMNSVALVTIDIGGDDVLGCVRPAPNNPNVFTIDRRCFNDRIGDIKTNLPTILASLRAAAGPAVPIVGMNYYDPLLASWIQEPGGRAAARDSWEAFLTFNNTLEGIYGATGSPVADVAGAFSSTDFETKVDSAFGKIPLNVARILQWTWQYSAGAPNANTEGYGVIANAFLQVIP